MRILRSTLGWFLVALGVLALGVWASASVVTHKVDSGSIASPFISTVLNQAESQSTITEQAQSLMTDALAQNGVPIAGTPEEQTLNAVIADAVASGGFIDDLVDIIEEIESSIIAQLTDDTLPLAPLIISFDITEPLYAVLEANPEVSGLVPPTTLDPVTFEPFTADEVSSIRDRYDWVQAIATWGLWVGLALIALGVLAIPRKRWIIPKLLLGLGVIVLVLWFLASKVEVASLLDRLPGGLDSEIRDMANDLVPQSRIDGVQSNLFKIAVALLVLGAIAYTLVWFLSRGKKSKADAEPKPEREPEPALARTAATEGTTSVVDGGVGGTTASLGTADPAAPLDPAAPSDPVAPSDPAVPSDPVEEHPEPGGPLSEKGDLAGSTG